MFRNHFDFSEPFRKLIIYRTRRGSVVMYPVSDYVSPSDNAGSSLCSLLIQLFAQSISFSLASTEFPSRRNARPSTASAIWAQISNGRLTLPAILLEEAADFTTDVGDFPRRRKCPGPVTHTQGKQASPTERYFAPPMAPVCLTSPQQPLVHVA